MRTEAAITVLSTEKFREQLQEALSKDRILDSFIQHVRSRDIVFFNKDIDLGYSASPHLWKLLAEEEDPTVMSAIFLSLHQEGIYYYGSPARFGITFDKNIHFENK